MSKTTSDDEKVQIVTYNVLSSHLCAPSWFVKTDPEHLDQMKRLEKVFKKLDSVISKNPHTVFGLQEISLTWRTKFKVFFQKYDYDFICTNYGGDHSNYMGVAIAYPRSRFEMKDGKIFRARDSVEWKRIWKKRSSSDTSKKWNLATSSLILTAAAAFALDLDPKTKKTLVTTSLLGSLGICLARSFGLVDKPAPRPKQTALEISKSRYNRQIIVTLRDKNLQRDLGVSVYHMPCVFWNQQVMVIHASLCASALSKYAKERELKSYLLVGDFNFSPDSVPYQVITQGKIEKKNKNYPELPKKEKWTPNDDLVKMNSAYAMYDAEPTYTNHAHAGREPITTYTGTIDYIFCSPDIKVSSVIPLPKFEEGKTELCPNAIEPSDHLMIGATLIY
eukprot:g4868.t1